MVSSLREFGYKQIYPYKYLIFKWDNALDRKDKINCMIYLFIDFVLVTYPLVSISYLLSEIFGFNKSIFTSLDVHKIRLFKYSINIIIPKIRSYVSWHSLDMINPADR